MPNETSEDKLAQEDVRILHRLGYAQELARCMGAFSNFAISLSIICILSGGITSFHLGFCSVGGAAIGLGWPLVALFALGVAAAMGQIASAFPTAGGLYHWAAILGGRGWGWITAWFNLAGLVTALAAVNVGAFEFGQRAFFPDGASDKSIQFIVVLAMTLSQAFVNHIGMRLTARLTDFSGYLILAVAALLTIALMVHAPHWEPERLVTFSNYGSDAQDAVWPAVPTWQLFFLGFLLPIYTISGYDASAHAAEETIGAGRRVPNGIVGAVFASGLAGWIMLCAFVLAMPDLDEGAEHKEMAFYWMLGSVLPGRERSLLCVGIFIAQYLCGLAVITSASRMAFAFARDGGLPGAAVLRRVSPRQRTPAASIWAVSLASVVFTVFTPVYEIISVVCAIFLYISYVLPIGLGLVAYGRWWTRMGPWRLGIWYRPLALLSVLGCLALIAIGMQPPNESAVCVVASTAVLLLALWFGVARRHFPGPPRGVLDQHRLDEIHAAEVAVQQEPIVESPCVEPNHG